MSDFMQGNPDTGAITVPFSDDDAEKKTGEDLDEELPASATPQERLTRRQKQQERLQRLIAEGRQAKEENAALKAEQERQKAELERMKGFLAAQQQQRPANDGGKDPWEARLDAVYQKQADAYRSAQAEIAAKTFDADRQKHYERIAREVETEKARIHTERAIAGQTEAQKQQQARAIWESKYPEVYGNKQAYDYAEATYKRRQALGEAPTGALVDEVMNETMTTFRLGPKKAPTASEKSRMSGIPSSGTGGGGGRSEGITATPEIRRMAAAAYPDLPEKQALEKWTNKTGKRLREKKIL